VHVAGYEGVSPDEYRRRIQACALYDGGNSAFATTILAAVLPVYYSRVAGETLASPAAATAFWTAGLSIALFLVAIISPILGTISDVRRGKKPLLAGFAGLGIVSTGLLVLVGSGDWLLASLFFVLGRIGFGAANVFYDALLPHVARPEDRDRVSSLGYALGYTGGGLLLAVNAVMIMTLGEIPGSRLSFLSVALWWAVFTIPVLRRVPEPPAATVGTTGSVRASVARLRQTFRHLRRYRELFKYLISFFIYNDGIGTVIGVAAIYGAELGFAATELILALLLVQFVGIPFTLLFGRMPSSGELGRRPIILAFVVFNLLALPVVGIIGSRTLDSDVVGRPGPAFETIDGAVGQEEWPVTDPAVELEGSWSVVPGDELAGTRDDYAFTSDPDGLVVFAFNGREVEITYSRGPDHGGFLVELDGAPVLDEDDEPLRVNAYNTAERFGEAEIVDSGEAGIHTLRLVNAGPIDEEATGLRFGVASLEVLEPTRDSSLITVLGILAVLQVICAALAFVSGRALFSKAAGALDTKRTVLLALAVYSVVAVWGFFLDTVLEFWFIAWMVAMVQGGSQALSRSLYSAMSPTSMSGEFFGLFSIMEKASAILGPFVFAGAVILFDSSRPAVLMVVVFFLAGGYLLTRVDVAEGRRVAEEADRRGLA
jgi:UMF1 family MFS transporter